jgi:uncharacterized protein YjbI with pentapeptide repeats
MANEEHLSLLRQGTAIWNEWYRCNPNAGPDLSGANLSGVDLSEVDLSGANFRKADLSKANLSKANLATASLNGANLRNANLSGAHLDAADLSRADLNGADLSGADLLHGANLSGANLTRTNLSEANLNEPNLSGANLRRADLHDVDLSRADLSKAFLSWAFLGGTNLGRANLAGANLSGTFLAGANLSGANLSGANLSKAILLETILANVDLETTIGLDNCEHRGPSVIDFKTLSRSANLPISFLRGCGLPDLVIDYLPSLRDEGIKFYSCFISYSAKDQLFAERLYADLQNKGVRCWFSPHDLTIGAKTWDAIDEAIRLRDKLLVILSEAAISSDWVEDEVTKALAEERLRKQLVLFPIRIDNAVMSTGEPWAVKLRDQRNIGDFRQWRKPEAYQTGLERLLRDLKAPPTK